ncbi:hypothetical protein PoB_003140600 [Plakobranchus ocellatus]|uniref:Uncharacterized protein n=1 Tax=Plakobranchus ocellatus TaxID=259542 RepID=A0AAV4A0Z9_9GAST|nr:hypothetical protein PoB_003140600 [Plakobranchus ocellatus]
MADTFFPKRNIPESKRRQDKNYTNREFDSKLYSISKSEADLMHCEDKAGFTINIGLNDVGSKFKHVKGFCSKDICYRLKKQQLHEFSRHRIMAKDFSRATDSSSFTPSTANSRQTMLAATQISPPLTCPVSPLSLQQKNKTSIPEPKSILKNSPRRRDIINLDERSTGQVVNGFSVTQIQTSPVKPPLASFPSSSSVSSRNTDTFHQVSDTEGPFPSIIDGNTEKEDPSTILIQRHQCYSQAISKRVPRPRQPQNSMVSMPQSDSEILSRCSYRLGVAPISSAKSPVSKKVQFHDHRYCGD